MNKQVPSPADQRPALTLGATFVLALLRIAVGWHFLYEGMVKVFSGDWTARDYLLGSTGPLGEVFARMAENAVLLRCVDYLNIAGLIGIGAALMLGLFTRTAAVCGMLLLALYYLAYPPFFGSESLEPSGGHYLLVNINLVEILALLVIAAMPARMLGLDGILSGRRRRRVDGLAGAPIPPRTDQIVMNLAPADFSRRRLLTGLAGLPFVGGYVLAVMKRHGWHSFEEQQLAGQTRVDARSGATRKFDFSTDLAALKGRPPIAQIGNVRLSRLILGGNLIGGWAHARDLLYVSKLVKAYHNRRKVWETLRLAEAAGINTILTNPALCEIINDYWKNARGRIQFISDCGLTYAGATMPDTIRRSVDNGACACYIRGADTDEFVDKGDFDAIGKALELMRKNKVQAGIGAHQLASVQACIQKGLIPDFWVKTLHHKQYWSAAGQQECDNIWCSNPEETIRFMQDLPQPWIAFKVLAAGAITPKDAFRYAFTSGADFICVGMYDFQIIEDVNEAVGVLADRDNLQRQRPWRA